MKEPSRFSSKSPRLSPPFHDFVQRYLPRFEGHVERPTLSRGSEKLASRIPFSRLYGRLPSARVVYSAASGVAVRDATPRSFSARGRDWGGGGAITTSRSEVLSPNTADLSTHDCPEVIFLFPSLRVASDRVWRFAGRHCLIARLDNCSEGTLCKLVENFFQ